MQKPTETTCSEEDVTIPLYISGTIVCDDSSSPTQKQLEDCPLIVPTSPHDWDPHSIHFAKDPHSKEEEYLFDGIAAISVDTLRRKVHETDIDPWLNDTIQKPYLITTRLVSEVRISDTKVPDATKITDLDEGVFKG